MSWGHNDLAGPAGGKIQPGGPGGPMKEPPIPCRGHKAQGEDFTNEGKRAQTYLSTSPAGQEM
eukprot:885007-Alexandrium_andersonii.AAC.1